MTIPHDFYIQCFQYNKTVLYDVITDYVKYITFIFYDFPKKIKSNPNLKVTIQLSPTKLIYY